MPDTKPAAPTLAAPNAATRAPLANQRVSWFNGQIVPES